MRSSSLFQLVSGVSRGFVTFVKSNAKALLTLRIKSALRPAGWFGALPHCLRTIPQCSIPFEKGSRTASLNFIPLAVRQEKKRCFSSVGKCYPWQKVKGFGLYFLSEISTRKYAPLTFYPLPVTVVSMVTMFLTTPPLSKTPSRPSPSSRR